jgi:hypothetical protein
VRRVFRCDFELQDIGPSTRAGHALGFDSIRERVVLFGGTDGGSTPLADTWEWDGTEWTQMADTGPSGRVGHAMTFDSKIKRVVLFGGFSNQQLAWELYEHS